LKEVRVGLVRPKRRMLEELAHLVDD